MDKIATVSSLYVDYGENPGDWFSDVWTRFSIKVASNQSVRKLQGKTSEDIDVGL